MIESLKKVELHLHLDGSVSKELACKLTNLDSLTIFDKMVAQNKFHYLG